MEKLNWDEIEITRMGCNHIGYYDLLEFCKEVSLPPYNDSNIESLFKTLQIRAKDILEKYKL